MAAGEGTTRQPEIIVWKYNDEMAQFEEYCILKGHKLSIAAVKFSPNSKYLVSLGDKFDKGLFVWSIPDKTKIT